MSGGHAGDQVPPNNVTPINPAAADLLPANATPPNHKDAAAEAAPASGTMAALAEAVKAAEKTSELKKDLSKQVREARELLFYASDEGIEIEKSLIETIVSASEKNDDLNQQEIVAVITSITTLSKELRVRANRSIRPFLYCVVGLGIFLIVISTFSFLAGSYSKALSDEITRANQFALDLNAGNVTQLADVEMRKNPITDTKTLISFQQFAASIRSINETSNLLGWLVLTPRLSDEELMVEDVPASPAPGAAGTPAAKQRPPLELRIPATYGQIKDKTEQFQTVRAHARGLQDRVTGFYGALTNAILPSLYAILGVCCFLLKTFSDQVRAHTFRLSADAEGARFIIAAIGGGVVGLFGNFTSGSGDSLSLLAVAFLIGYATDVFFTFLDGLEQAFMKSKSSAQEQKGDGAAKGHPEAG